MLKSLIAALLLVCGGALCAQTPAVKKKAAADKKPAAAQAAAPAAQPAQSPAQPMRAAKTETPKAPAVRQAESEAEESVVMIDSKAESETAGEGEDPESVVSYSPEREERAVSYGLPSSYGQCKGVLNDAGRNILVFESQDDGAVYFVQVRMGKSNVSWQLISRIPRSSD